MLIVGLNAHHGDVAAAIVRDGQLIAALEEERFCRIKHVAGFPAKAVPGKVPVDVLDRLTGFVAGLTVLIALASSWLFTRFPISKADHEARLAKLAVASAESGGNS